MKEILLERLSQSFAELERAIFSAKLTFERRSDTPKEVFQRIKSYEEILDKQKSLASALGDHMRNKNWPEVSRHIQLINALSVMIRDDAREIVGAKQRIEAQETRPEVLS